MNRFNTHPATLRHEARLSRATNTKVPGNTTQFFLHLEGEIEHEEHTEHPTVSQGRFQPAGRAPGTRLNSAMDILQQHARLVRYPS